MSEAITNRLRREGSDALAKHYSLGMWTLCANAADVIDALTNAVEQLLTDIEEYERIKNLSPTPGKKDCWQSVTQAKAALVKARGEP